MKRIDRLRRELRGAKRALATGLKSRHEMFWADGAREYIRVLEADIERLRKNKK